MLSSNKPLGVDVRKATVVWRYIKFFFWLTVVYWLGLITRDCYGIVILVSGVCFSALLTFEPYYSALPKELPEHYSLNSPGFAWRGRWVFNVVVDSKQVKFYWMPYNQLYVWFLKPKAIRKWLLTKPNHESSLLLRFLVVLLSLRHFRGEFRSNGSLSREWSAPFTNEKISPELKELLEGLVRVSYS